MTAIIGIDPGMEGAIAFIHNNKVQIAIMPILNDEIYAEGLAQILRGWLMFDPYSGGILATAYLEKLWGVPGWSNKALFKYAGSYWIPKTILQILKIPVVDVAPKTWKSKVLGNQNASKQEAIDFCEAKYPGLVGNHDGKADALCIAYYGLLYEST